MKCILADGIALISIYGGGFFLILAVCGFIADKLLPRIRPLQRWINAICNVTEPEGHTTEENEKGE